MKSATPKKPDLSRDKPRRRGVRYCSPSCGRGCTITEYNQATELANAIAATLGKDWKGVVWENMGWHSKAVHATGIAVYFHAPRVYWATTDVDGFPQHHAKGTTARRAARAVAAALVETVQTGSLLIAAVHPTYPPIPLFLRAARG